MALQYLWWIAAAILVGVEMMTGTFYLLIVGLACVAGGVVAMVGLDTGWQGALRRSLRSRARSRSIAGKRAS